MDARTSSKLREMLHTPLAEGWKRHTSKRKNRDYYYHADSGVTTWERPSHPLQAVMLVSEQLQAAGQDNSIASGFRRCVADVLVILQESIASQLGLYDGSPRSVCDLGCGASPKLHTWCKRADVVKYVGVEISSRLCKVASHILSGPSCTVVCDDGSSDYFTAGMATKLGRAMTFDFVLSWMGAFDFCPPDRMGRLLSNAAAIMKSDGSMLVLCMDADAAMEAILDGSELVHAPPSRRSLLPMYWLKGTPRVVQVGKGQPSTPVYLHTQTEIAELARAAGLTVVFNQPVNCLLKGMMSGGCPMVEKCDGAAEYTIRQAMASSANQVKLFRVFVLQHARK
jgi:hypothetical protein